MLIELAYFPSVSWWSLAHRHGQVLIESCDNFQKGTYRNRCHIASPNGEQRLSIPLVKGKHQQTPIREVEISYTENWQQIHWRSIKAAYGKSPFFEHFSPVIEPFFKKKYRWLFDLNVELLEVLRQKMGLDFQISFSETYLPPPAEGIFDARNLISPKSKTAAELFTPKKYPQVFEDRHGFLPDLSGLDLMFCCGRQSRDYL